MKNNGEKNKCDCVNKSICDEKLDKVVGGGMVTPKKIANIDEFKPTFGKGCSHLRAYNLFKNRPEKKELIKKLHEICISERSKGFNCDQCSENCELYKLDADSL